MSALALSLSHTKERHTHTHTHTHTFIGRILDRPEFNDPEQLKELFRKGVEEFKDVSTFGVLVCRCVCVSGTCPIPHPCSMPPHPERINVCVCFTTDLGESDGPRQRPGEA